MIDVPGGATLIGSDRFYPEERPLSPVTVDDVRWDAHLVTNEDFAEFVAATGHQTVPELPLDPHDFPGADPALLVPGSLVFTQPSRPVPLHDWTLWWRWQEGATWREPEGPGSSWTDVADHPVVHVGWEDATAYAAWAGKRLPTEPEWEHAARGGLVGAEFAWGDELEPQGAVLANTWQGRFPWQETDQRGHRRTSPVSSYPANGYGLYDMIGNVWEWTSSPWTPSHARLSRSDLVASRADDHIPACCGGARQPTVSEVRETDRMVSKGGSHLCSPDYCQRYRPAARQGHGVRDTTSHLGFRCVRSARGRSRALSAAR